MSYQSETPFDGTALDYFRTDSIKAFVDANQDTNNSWSLFGKPEHVTPNDNYKSILSLSNTQYTCRFKSTNWLNEYTVESALNDLMNFYANFDPKISKSMDTDTDDAAVLKPFGFNCEIAKALNINFSTNFANTITKLMDIVVLYNKLALEKMGHNDTLFTQDIHDSYSKIIWIISEVLPILFIWITELHIKRAKLPIYTDTTFNYITQAFLLLQGQSYAANGEKMLFVRKKLISHDDDDINGRVNFVNAVTMTYANLISNIRYLVDKVIENVNSDNTLSSTERHIILAAIYCLRYNADKIHMADKRSSFNSLASKYKEWLEELSIHCDLANKSNTKLSKDSSSVYVRDNICTRLGTLTMKPIDPASITKAGVSPIPV
jgi:hypothetical protein